jgi:uncharacterized protein YgiM (DUF1202 family)
VPAFVNLRQGPSMEAEIIKVLKKGTKLTLRLSGINAGA